jgi:hypothetical protein
MESKLGNQCHRHKLPLTNEQRYFPPVISPLLGEQNEVLISLNLNMLGEQVKRFFQGYPERV